MIEEEQEFLGKDSPAHEATTDSPMVNYRGSPVERTICFVISRLDPHQNNTESGTLLGAPNGSHASPNLQS